MSNMISGKVAFSVLTTTDFFKGKDTGQYKLTVTLDDDSAKQLEEKGVKLKEYEGTMQRSFKSKHKVEVLNMDGSPFTQEIPRGSMVRVLYGTGPNNKDYGVPVYMNKIRLVSLAEGAEEVPEEF
jgi:hypothetical protein